MSKKINLKTNSAKSIIKWFDDETPLSDFGKIKLGEAEKLLRLSEKKEEESNQIVEFTREIKKYSVEFRLKIIEIIWKIVYSDGASDIYESNLVRRICGLLYVSDKDNGIIKTRVENLFK